MSRIARRASLTLLVLLTLAALRPVAALGQQNPDPALPGQVAVRLVAGFDVEAFKARHGIVQTLRSIPGRDIYLFQVPQGQDDQAFTQRLDDDPDSIWAEQNYFADGPEGSGRNFYCNVLPDSSVYTDQLAWGQVNLSTAHMVSTGQGMILGIVDGGIDAAHPAFAGRVLPGGFNFVDQNGDVSDVGDGLDNDGDGDVDELLGHGTHVSGVAIFVAPDARILPIKVLDSDGNTDNFKLAQGLFFAVDNGAHVINVSIGSTYDSKAVEDALNEARAAGVVVAAAAGNVNLEHPSWEFPALRDEAIGVVAVDEDDVRAPFTNYNVRFDLAAPGVHIFSPIPGNLYADLDGTSPATAFVSGTAALLIAAHPEWLPNETRAIQVQAFLEQTAFDIDPLNPGFEGKLGAGRLDAGAALNATIAFDPPRGFPVGNTPSDVAVADLNGDHWADLAVSNAGGNTVTILLNSRDGSFVRATDLAVGARPEALVAADFDRDGDLDLASADSDSGRVSVLLNGGDGSFAAARPFQTGAGPVALVAADFDADGLTDLATADDDGGSVSVLINTGGAGFALRASIPVGQRPRDLVVARLDADAAPDLAVVCRGTNDVRVLINRGDGSFATPTAYAVGPDPRWLTGGDLDLDGDVDLVSANSDSKDLSLLRNAGDGSFAPALPLDLFARRTPGALTAGDFDCDGDADMAVINGDPPAALLSLVLNDGRGAFPGRFDFNVGPVPENLAAGDLDDDADLDLAVVEVQNNQVVVLRNQSCPAHIRGDLNCDGVVNAADIEGMVLALFDPSGYAQRYPNCDLRTGDVNRDGRVDSGDIEGFIELLFAP